MDYPTPALYETLRQRLWSQELQRYETFTPGAAGRMEEWVDEARAAVKAAGGDPYDLPPVPLALRLRTARSRLVQLRTDLATVRAARTRNRGLGMIAGAAYYATRRRTLKRILEARADLRDLGVQWINERRTRLAALPIAWQSPLDNIYCCAEAEFLKDGGTETEFAVAAREYRRAA